MKRTWRQALVIGVIAGLLTALITMGEPQAADDEFSLTIATGQIGGLYHPVGGAICKLVNDQRNEHGMTCTVEITSGSIENINDVRAGDADLAFAQSDWQHDAFKGVGPFNEAGPFEGLRAVFAIYVEHFTVVVRGDKDIKSFEDLKGKRIHMGGAGSGRRQTMQAVLKAYGWADDDVTDVSEFKATNEAEALCDNEFDAFAYTIGHPNPTVKEATATCGALLLPVEGPIVDKLVKTNPFYIASTIPGGTYLGNPRDVPGLGLVATLVTSNEAKPEAIYHVTKTFFENLENLRSLAPIFSSLSEKDMAGTVLTAPLHSGAAKYFTEAGLM